MRVRGIVAAAAATGLVAAVGWGFWSLDRPYAGWNGPACDVVIEPGLAAGTVLERLGRAGVLRNVRLARAWLVLRGGAERLRAGEYRFERPASVLEVLDRLERGDVVLHLVTLPEGLRLDEVARRLEEAGFGSAKAFETVFADPRPVHDIDTRARDLEGYLFPDTYHFPRGERPERIAATMVERFREVTTPDFAQRAAAVGLSVHEAVALASLIEKETSVPEERGRISQVFHNRLRRGMKLECDPTVRYALERIGRPAGPLTYRDLEIDSPWNTYRVQGLPPGPIANPGRESLEAAVGPADGNDLYFVASPAGGHRFSENLASHLAAVAVWRRHSRSSR